MLTGRVCGLVWSSLLFFWTGHISRLSRPPWLSCSLNISFLPKCLPCTKLGPAMCLCALCPMCSNPAFVGQVRGWGGPVDRCQPCPSTLWILIRICRLYVFRCLSGDFPNAPQELVVCKSYSL